MQRKVRGVRDSRPLGAGMDFGKAAALLLTVQTALRER
jgi:hypothetical protein